MARDLHASLQAATLADAIGPIILVELLLDNAPVRMWSGIGDLSWRGDTWVGTGNLLGISPVEETLTTQATGLDVSLSGVPSDLVSVALSENYNDRTAKVYAGALDLNSGALLGDPYNIFSGRLDTMKIEEGGESALITISIESELIDLERPRERRYESADQHIDYPSDDFFKFVPSIQDAEVQWGQST